MVAFPPFPAPDSGSGGPQRAKARLAVMRAGAAAPPDQLTADQGGQTPAGEDSGNRDSAIRVVVDPEPAEALSDNASGPSPREGRLVRRWVPAALRDARWEPARPGAFMLSLVAALAAVLAAVGVWRDRPVPVAAPPLPLVAPAGTADPGSTGNPVRTGNSAGAAVPAGSPSAVPELVVSVVGRVARPGLVRIPDGSRVADALDAAGGALPETDLVALNLARRLSDGEQLLVGVAPPPGQPAGGGVVGAPAAAAPLVDLNTATVEQLDALPGVGPVTAQRILDWRATHGRFTSVDQLREVSGIGEAKFSKLKDLVRV